MTITISASETPSNTSDRGSLACPPSALAGTISIREAAAREGVCVRTIWNWITLQGLPVRRTVGGRVRIRIEDLDARNGWS